MIAARLQSEYRTALDSPGLTGRDSSLEGWPHCANAGLSTNGDQPPKIQMIPPETDRDRKAELILTADTNCAPHLLHLTSEQLLHIRYKSSTVLARSAD